MFKAYFMRSCLAIFLPWSIYSLDAVATTQTVFFDTMNASNTVLPLFSAGDTLFVDTLVRSQTGALSQSVTFTLGTGATGITGQAAWMTSTAAGPGPRLIGVNIDLINANTNALIASDLFSGTLGGFAQSTFSGNIGPGTYKLITTGTGLRESLFDIALSFTGTPPLASATGSGSLPAQSSNTSDPTAFFNNLIGTRTIGTAFGAGDTLVLDSLVTSETGSLLQTVNFTLDTGVDSLMAEAAWMISTAAGPGPRLTGVNLDLFDASNTLIASDIFIGTIDGMARSTFSGAIGPGAYKLVASGSGIRDSSLDIALSFGGTATSTVPEPQSGTLVVAGLVSAVLFSRCRRRMSS